MKDNDGVPDEGCNIARIEYDINNRKVTLYVGTKPAEYKEVVFDFNDLGFGKNAAQKSIVNTLQDLTGFMYVLVNDRDGFAAWHRADLEIYPGMTVSDVHIESSERITAPQQLERIIKLVYVFSTKKVYVVYEVDGNSLVDDTNMVWINELDIIQTIKESVVASLEKICKKKFILTQTTTEAIWQREDKINPKGSHL